MKKLSQASSKSNAACNKLSIKDERRLKVKNELKGRIFERIKFKEYVYSVGDIVEVRVLSSSVNSVAKIMKILHSHSHSKYSYWPMIEVEWLYQKHEFEGLGLTEDFSSIGRFEAFPSNHRDFIFIESIVKKVSLISLEEYQSLEVLNEGVYYSRGKVDIIKVKSLLKDIIRKRLSSIVIHGSHTAFAKSLIIQIKYTFSAIVVWTGFTLIAQV